MGEMKPTNHHQKPLPSSSFYGSTATPGEAAPLRQSRSLQRRRHPRGPSCHPNCPGTAGWIPCETTTHVEVMNRWKKLISHDLTLSKIRNQPDLSKKYDKFSNKTVQCTKQKQPTDQQEQVIIYTNKGLIGFTVNQQEWDLCQGIAGACFVYDFLCFLVRSFAHRDAKTPWNRENPQRYFKKNRWPSYPNGDVF